MEQRENNRTGRRTRRNYPEYGSKTKKKKKIYQKKQSFKYLEDSMKRTEIYLFRISERKER